MRRIHLERLASALEISFEQALGEVGGKTAEQIFHERGIAQAAEWLPAAGTEARRSLAALGGRSRKGKPQTPALAAANAKVAKTTRMKVIKGLFIRMTRHEPTPENLTRWAHDVASTHHLSQSAVTNYWRPYLKRRQLGMLIGRPRLADRQTLIDRRLAEGKSWDAIHAELKEGQAESPAKPRYSAPITAPGRGSKTVAI